MGYLLGIDLGTSSVKSVLMSDEGSIKAIGQNEYTFDIPCEGWAEQDPEVWWNATVATIQAVLAKADIKASEIRGIGFSGQMHGMVLLDRSGRPLRKAIIWCDQRSVNQVEHIKQVIGNVRLGEIAHNQIATGFQTASLLWVKENEPSIYEQIDKVILPKDYIRYQLTGELATDVTDASSTLALDVRAAKWSDEIIQALGLRRDIYPHIYLPYAIAGKITEQAAAATGLKAGTAVVYGGADQVMQAIGNGIIAPGQASVTIGTGAQVFAPLAEPIYDSQLRSHTFNNYDENSWYFMGATLCGGLSLRWLRDKVLEGISYEEMSQRVAKIPQGSEGLIYLPYMSGERTPHMDPYARGMLFGLTLNHTRDHIMRAMMEGVVFSLKDCLGILQTLGGDCDSIIASGGGARSTPWLQMQADIFNKPIYTSNMVEQAGVGAAITAGCGTGVYTSFKQACDRVIQWNDKPYLPHQEHAKRYEEYYQLFQSLYVSNKGDMKRCTQLSNRAD